MAAGPVLEVESLTFQYRRATEPAIRDISFSLEPGEVLLVAGPSGCGKSTLIRAINGLIPHSYRGELSGRVAVDGRATTEVRLRDLAVLVGTVLQDPRKQLVASTVSAELAFGPENLGIPRTEMRQRLAEVVTASGIEHLVERTTDQLSGGEAQQLAIAGALMLRPQLLVLDEPLANLDPAAAYRLLELVRGLADGGTAVVIVEHRVEDVLEARPDRVLYLEEGGTRYLGPLPGFLDVVDPNLVKVPFSVHLARAHVFQNPSQMLFAPNVRDEILFGPRNLDRDASGFDELVTTSLARVNLAEPEVESRPPLTLSYGQQKRLAIGVALALKPRTLVLDEPSAGQDHRSATAFMQEIERIDGLESVYFVTHDADLALTHADRILLMRDGRIAADGTPLEVIADRERWIACNLRFTSLMEANARWRSGSERFLGAQELAAWVAEASGRTEEGRVSQASNWTRDMEEGLEGT